MQVGVDITLERAAAQPLIAIADHFAIALGRSGEKTDVWSDEVSPGLPLDTPAAIWRSSS
jgi:hypothetical protein